MNGLMTLARLALLRLRRGRMRWVTALLLVIPPVAALLQPGMSGGGRFALGVESALRLVVMVAMAVHLANALGEELDGKMYTYLWSRPIARPAILLGKALAVVPLVIASAALSVGVAFALSAGGPAGAIPGALGAALMSVLFVGLSAAASALGLGVLVPRHPLMAVLAYFLLVEQLLSVVPNVAALSILAHGRVVAGIEGHVAGSGSAVASAAYLLVIGGLWLGLGLWRVSTGEPGKVGE